MDPDPRRQLQSALSQGVAPLAPGGHAWVAMPAQLVWRRHLCFGQPDWLLLPVWHMTGGELLTTAAAISMQEPLQTVQLRDILILFSMSVAIAGGLTGHQAPLADRG